MGKYIDLIGKKIGRLLIIKRVDDVIQPNGKSVVRYLCKCDCGKEIIVRKDCLGRSTFSCGCIKHEKDLKGNPKHNLSHTRLYKIWSGMKSRCYNKNFTYYNYYGNRGIKICDEWLGKNGFINFYNWSMTNGYKDNLTIDRINNDRNYEPNNCRWITLEEQSCNRRCVKKILYKNSLYTIKELSKIYNIDSRLLHLRLKRGWNIEKAIKEPVHIKHRGRWENE